jgi:hypothetical protein
MHLQGGYGAAPAAAPAQYVGGGATVRNAAAPMITDISKLSAYSARWTIKGRCTMKARASPPSCLEMRTPACHASI